MQPVNYIQAEVSCITVLQILVLSVEITKLSRYLIDSLICYYWVEGKDLNLESVGWNDDSRRLSCSQRHLRDLSLRFMLCFFEQDQCISKFALIFIILQSRWSHLIKPAIDERLMVDRRCLLLRHPRGRAARWSAQPVLCSCWRDQVLRLWEVLWRLDIASDLGDQTLPLKLKNLWSNPIQTHEDWISL